MVLYKAIDTGKKRVQNGSRDPLNNIKLTKKSEIVRERDRHRENEKER